jgi:hypothetical protein
MHRIAVLASFVLLAFLVACGGGGGSTTASIPGGNPPNAGPIGATTAPIAATSSPPSSSPTPGATSTGHGVVPPSNAPAPISTVSPTPTPTPSSLVYVANTDGTTMQILAFPPNTGGNVAPVKKIAGSATQLEYPQSLTFDAAGNLYVLNETPGGTNSATFTITVYGRGSNGNAAPVRVIGGSNTGLNDLHWTGGWLNGLAVDSSGYLYVLVNTETANTASNPEDCVNYSIQNNYNNQIISVFPPNANGNVAPVRTINASDCFTANGIVVAPSGNIEVSGTALNNIGSASAPEDVFFGQIVMYAPAASGNATPLNVINGAKQGFGPIARSPAGMLYVAAHPEYSGVLGYPETANGGSSPSIYIANGGNPNWYPASVAEDADSILYVLNTNGPQILEFGSTANNDDPPIFTIAGSHTGLLSCNSSTLCTWGDVAVGPP